MHALWPEGLPPMARSCSSSRPLPGMGVSRVPPNVPVTLPSLSLSSSPGHEGCLTPLAHKGPPLFMGALEECESLDVSP